MPWYRAQRPALFGKALEAAKRRPRSGGDHEPRGAGEWNLTLGARPDRPLHQTVGIDCKVEGPSRTNRLPPQGQPILRANDTPKHHRPSTEYASRTFPGVPPKIPDPDPTYSMPSTTTAPPPLIEPPLAATPLTV